MASRTSGFRFEISWATLLRASLPVCLLAFAGALALQRIKSLDYWWHLRTGQLIAEWGGVPVLDPYSYSVPSARWLDVTWLHQLLLHGLYSLGGHDAVVLAQVAIVLGIVALVANAGAAWRSPTLAVGIITLMLVIASSRFMPRPGLASLGLLTIVLMLFDRHHRSPDRWIYGVIPVIFVWVNVHGLFALGIAVCGIHLVGELIRPVCRPGTRIRTKMLRRFALVTLGAIMVTPLNPYGLDAAMAPLGQLRIIGPVVDGGLVSGAIVRELLRPLDPRQPSPPMLLAAFFLLASLTAISMIVNAKRLRESDPLLWGAFLYLAFAAHRNLAIFAVVAAAISMRNFGDWMKDRDTSGRASRLPSLALLALLVFLCVDVARNTFYPRIGVKNEIGLGIASGMQPEAAVDWIDRNRPPAPLAHSNVNGGYLIWRLHPTYRVLTDGRIAVYRDRWKQLMIENPIRFMVLDEAFNFGTVLLQFNRNDVSDLLRHLHRSGDWQLAFVDDVAAVYVRSPKTGEASVGWSATPPLNVASPELFAPLSSVAGPGDLSRRIARRRFYAAVGQYDLALGVWSETLRIYPDAPRGKLNLAVLLWRTGARDRSERVLDEWKQDNARDPKNLALATRFYRTVGEPEKARELMERVRQLDPSFDAEKSRPISWEGRAAVSAAILGLVVLTVLRRTILSGR